MKHPTRKPRWWRRFPVRLSVQTSMVLVLALAAGLGWFVRRARVQREAVVAIRSAGGNVAYDSHWQDGGWVMAGAVKKSPWPKWLVDSLGPDYFYTAMTVEFSEGSKVDDALLDQVGRLGRLEVLRLNGRGPVTDASLRHIRGLTALTSIRLNTTEVTGAGLVHLEGMTRLRGLTLPEGRITDADLAHIRGLTALVRLEGHPEITDAGMVHLKGLVNLEMLDFRSPRITSTGLRSLRDLDKLWLLSLRDSQVSDLSPIHELRGLRSLVLSGCPVDDAGLASIEGFDSLEGLALDRTKVTDAVLAHLRGLKRLAGLSLGQTAVTDAGLETLGGIPQLERLALDHTKVSDVGLLRLAGLNKLTTLSLRGTNISDAGLCFLNGMKLCKEINVRETAATEAGIQSAQRNRPQTKFVRNSN